MKLFLKVLFVILSYSLNGNTSALKLNNYDTYQKSENKLLFNLWKRVPGAGDDALKVDPTLVASSVEPKFNDAFSNVLVEGWLTISSPIFKDETKFPVFTHPDGNAEILTGSEYTRINEKYRDIPVDKTQPARTDAIKTDPEVPPGRSYFYFRLNKQFLYFSEKKSSLNTLGSVDFVNDIAKSSIHFIDPLCFQMISNSGNRWKYCGQNNEESKKFICQIQTLIQVPQDEYCKAKNPETVVTPVVPPTPGTLVEKVINQPYILIPLAREMCNDQWNYEQHGKNWKCLCAEGKLL